MADFNGLERVKPKNGGVSCGVVPAFYERFAIPDGDFWQLRG
jgi:hypothetical protein